MPTASVILSVYSNTAALKTILDALKQQTYKDFQIVISEDAEHPHMKEFIENYSFSNPYIHLTQKDDGWRKNRALNNAVRQASGDYLIFVDGDCVPHRRFVEFHLRLADSKAIVAGKRIKLNKELSDWLVNHSDQLRHFHRKLRGFLLFKSKKEIGFLEDGFFLKPWGLWSFARKMKNMKVIKGNNFSLYKQALYDINGFDEDYILPAIGEDTDLIWRFELAGYTIRSARNLAIQYHLYHKENWSDLSENLLIMSHKQARNEYICKNGLTKY